MKRWLLAGLILLILGASSRGQSPVTLESGTAAISADTPIAERLRSLGGAALILVVAVALSEDRRRISPRIVLWGLGLQVGLGLFLLRVPIGQQVLRGMSDAVVAVLDCAIDGATFMFGEKLVDPSGPAGFVFAFRVLPTIVFVGCLFAVLYHLRIMQLIVGVFAWVMVRLMRTSGAETFDVAASLFLGQTEAPLTIRPYLARLTRSELMLVLVAGMAHVSGGVLGAYIQAGADPRLLLTAILMNAPGAILLSKILVPETGTPETLGVVRPDSGEPDANLLDAAARGTREGLHLAVNVAAMLIAFLAMIALVNLGLGCLGSGAEAVVGRTTALEGLTLGRIFGWVFSPVAWVLGIPWSEAPEVGSLLGTRLVLNELIAYGDLGAMRGELSARSYALATVAICGFANLSSIGIQIGGIGSLAPNRRADIARLGFKALLAGTLSNFLVAALVGVLT